MRQRNPEATCETCPAWERNRPRERHPELNPVTGEPTSRCEWGQCRGIPIYSGEHHEDHWCMQHPDFFLEDTVPGQEIIEITPEVTEMMAQFKARKQLKAQREADDTHSG